MTCSYTTADTYTFTVPAGVSSLDVTAVGAAGGSNFYGPAFGAGGAGASVEDTSVPVSGNQALSVVVGGVGTNGASTNGGAGGTPGGGAAGGDYPGGNDGAAGDGGGGGGYSGLLGPSNNPLVIAGGGGGGGGGVGGGGGAGGTPDGSAGGGGGLGGIVGGGAGGGGVGGSTTNAQGGAGGDGCDFTFPGGTGNHGSSLAGGQGGVSNGEGGTNSSGGGGGGGYFGGGGGGGGCSAGGGGGGSSFGTTGLTNEATASGAASVTISYSLVSTSVSAPARGTVGTAIPPGSISATLSGAPSDATGTITFTVFGPRSSAPSSCAGGGTTVGTAGVSGNGTYHPSGGFTPPSAGTYWWYASYSGDGANQASDSGCGSGMTSTVVAAAPPTAATGSAESVTQTSATLNGAVNPNDSASTYYFQYGTSTAYGSSTPTQSAGSDTSDHSESASISGLSAGTTYHFRIVAVNSGGTSYGADHTFATQAQTPATTQASTPASTQASTPAPSPSLRSLKLSVSPGRAQAGSRACFAFTANSTGHPVAGVTIHLAGHTARTSRAGRATICLALRHGTYRPTANKTGFRRARAAITAAAASPTPSFTG